MGQRKFAVVTTIHEKTPSIAAFEARDGWHVVVVGDEKTPTCASTASLTYLDLDAQKRLGFSITAHLPLNHYGRKNVGYLYAIAQGADVIYNTDDDNHPYAHWGDHPIQFQRPARCFGFMVSLDASEKPQAYA